MPLSNTAAAGNIDAGSYVGDGNSPRTISLGYECAMVFVKDDASHNLWFLTNKTGEEYILITNAAATEANTNDAAYLHATDGFVVGAALNGNGVTYRYVAIGI
jgi:hypothetical protein